MTTKQKSNFVSLIVPFLHTHINKTREIYSPTVDMTGSFFPRVLSLCDGILILANDLLIAFGTALDTH